MSANKKIHIISGGTVAHVATHMALCAPAYGQVGSDLFHLCRELMPELDIVQSPTKMAGGDWIETNADVAKFIGEIKDDHASKIVFMPVALCDFEVTGVVHYAPDKHGVMDEEEKSRWHQIGKNAQRLRTSDGKHTMLLEPAPKLIPTIRDGRKDIFLVGFKTTDGATEDAQYIAGLNLLKEASCNLVLANDVKTRVNMVITPEEARYHITTDRAAALRGLVEMTKLRSHLTFTRSTVIAGEAVPWNSDLVPASLRAVVDHCIASKAYKPFRGATVGHFAAKLDEKTFITSKRKTNFNDLDKIGLVRIETDGPDTVLAYGAKPSVGGQSQRIVFQEHSEYDCIVHFHCPRVPRCAECDDTGAGMPGAYVMCPVCRGRTRDDVPVVSQREYECGSHQCGQNTSRGLKKFGNLSCVFLDQHGPNIVFHHSIDPAEVVAFIERNFDLSAKTGGYVDLSKEQP